MRRQVECRGERKNGVDRRRGRTNWRERRKGAGGVGGREEEGGRWSAGERVKMG